MATVPTDRFFALDLRFDWKHDSMMQYSFSERHGEFTQPGYWEDVEHPSVKKNRLGNFGDCCYLRIAVWGLNVDTRTDHLQNLCFDFSKSADHPCDQSSDTPFDDVLTARLSSGVTLGPDDAVPYDGSAGVWILNPLTQDPELPAAGFEERIGSNLWFNYFPQMIPGHYDFHVRLEVSRKPADKIFHLDPEMEVGDDDAGEGDDCKRGKTGN